MDCYAIHISSHIIAVDPLMAESLNFMADESIGINLYIPSSWEAEVHTPLVMNFSLIKRLRQRRLMFNWFCSVLGKKIYCRYSCSRNGFSCSSNYRAQWLWHIEWTTSACDSQVATLTHNVNNSTVSEWESIILLENVRFLQLLALMITNNVSHYNIVIISGSEVCWLAGWLGRGGRAERGG